MFGSAFDHLVTARQRYKMGAFQHPNTLFPGSETRVNFFATNASNLPH